MTVFMKKTDLIFLKAVSNGLDRQIMENPGLTEKEWEEILNLSVGQSLMPLVFEAVYPFLSETLEKRYRSAAITWIMKQAQATDEFLRTCRSLQEKGIEPLVFKGIVCRNAYSLPDWRVSGDEDIYVPRDQYICLHSALRELGYTGREPNFRSEHETVYHGKALDIEGHWDLFPHETRLWDQINTLTEDMMRRAVFTEIDGSRILTPEPTDHMVYLLLHTMKHFSLSGVGIRQICDIAVWSRAYPIEWDRVRDTLKAVGGLKFTQAVLDAGCRYFGMELPGGWERTDSEDLILDALEGGVFGQSSEDRLHSASITSAEGSTGHHTSLNILKAVFPNRQVMEINYPWISKSGLLLPVGWGVRLFQYAKKIGKESSPLRSIKIGTERVKLLKEYDVFQNDTHENS